MSLTDLDRPYLAALRAADGGAEFAGAEAGRLNSPGYPLADAVLLAPLARDIARSLTGAGFTLHHCAAYDLLYRLVGVCLLLVSAEHATGRSGISVSRTTHDRLLDQNRHSAYRDTRQAANAALGRVLRAFGFRVTRFGSGGVWLVTGLPRRGTEAGR